jgi:hypothetical protein
MKFLRPGDEQEHAAAFGLRLEEVREATARYLEDAPTVLSTPGGIREGQSWSEAWRCDGELIWSSGAPAAVRARRVVVPLELAQRVDDGARPPAALDAQQVERAIAAIVAYDVG